MFYVLFQKLVYYVQSSAQGPNATVIFKSSTSDGNSVQRFSQCLPEDTIPAGEVCLAPRKGDVVSRCSVCLDGYSSEKVMLEVTVPFADGCTDCATRYDGTFFNSHRVFPVTNHHSPLVTMLPVVTVPLLENVMRSVSIPVHAADEDGVGRPLTCRGSSSGCNNVDARWNLGPGEVVAREAGTTLGPLILEYHSDAVAFGEPTGKWIIGKRDENDGGGLHISVSGPLKEGTGSNTLQADAMYPGRMAVEDVFGVQTTIEFMLRVCGSVVPYSLDASGIALFDGDNGELAPIIVRVGRHGHERQVPRHVCYPDEPCVLNVTAVAYDSESTDRGFYLDRKCTWGPSRLSEDGSGSPRCVDHVRYSSLYLDTRTFSARVFVCVIYCICMIVPARMRAHECDSYQSIHASNTCALPCRPHSHVTYVRLCSSLPTGDSVTIDTSHPSLQGCPRSLQSQQFDPVCHTFSSHNPVPGIAVTTVTVFGARTLGPSMPGVGDIGRKIGMCFQARACPSCCYGLPECITIEIEGRTPKITLPLAPLSCNSSRFRSDSAVSSNIPVVTDYGKTCPHLYACWNLKDRSTDSSPGSPPPLLSPSQYSQEVAPTEFVLAATDQDVGETVDIELLWETHTSTLAVFANPSITSYSSWTLHPGGSCDRLVSERIEDLYKVDATCASASRVVNVATSYGPFPAPVYTAAQDGYNHVKFDGDKTICFVATDNQAVIWGRGLNNSALQCHVVRFRGPPVFIHRTVLGKTGRDSPFLDIDFNQMGNGTATLVAHVGREVNFTIRARDPNAEDMVTILIVEDPGIPIGATVGPNTCVDRGNVPDKMAYPVGGGTVASPCSEAYREFRWTPKEGEDGVTYRACFVAKDSAGFCAGSYSHVISDYGPRSTTGGYYSRPHCVDIRVESADTSWLPETVATEAGANRVEHVGCVVEYVVRAGGTNYNTLVTLSARMSAPPGMQLLTTAGGLTHSALLQVQVE